MSNLKERTLQLRRLDCIKGIRPIFSKVLKGKHSYKGKYAITCGSDAIYFYRLKFNDTYKGKLDRDFIVTYEELDGYRFAIHSTLYKKITLYLKNDTVYEFIFLCHVEESYDNENNAIYLMQKIKEKGIAQRNYVKGGKCEEKVISKRDQLFIKEVRSPSQKRGLFK